jgi:hypothetical protein
MIPTVVRVLRFWYRFVVGDDWTSAVGVAAVLVAGALVPHDARPWVVLVGTAAVLVLTVWRATLRRAPR